MVNVTRTEFNALTKLLEIADETRPEAAEIIKQAQAAIDSIEAKQIAMRGYHREQKRRERARKKAEKEVNA